MAVRHYQCPNCDGTVTVNFADRFFYREIVWFESHRCDQCRSALEADGRGRMPDELRAAMIDQHGTWGLHLSSDLRRNPKFLKCLRQSLALSMSAIADLLHSTAEMLEIGTFAETEMVLAALDEAGIRAKRIRMDKPQG